MDPTEPSPRDVTVAVERWQPVIGRPIFLPPAPLAPQVPFQVVLESRESRRKMSPPSLNRIAEFLWHGARVRAVAVGRSGLQWEHRASPSAGGLHAIRLICQRPGEGAPLLYDALRHQFGELSEFDGTLTVRFRENARVIVPDAEGALFCLVAEPCVVASAYKNHESLVWRDAGCLLATLHLCAQWLGLEFCPLGLLGNELVAGIDSAGLIVPAGSFMLGEACAPR